MAKFQGKWEDDKTKERKNLDELMEKLGVDAAMKETMNNSTNCLEYTIDENKITCIASFSAFPGKERTITATSGVEFEDIGLDGSLFKVIVTIDSETQITDRGKSETFGEYKIVRTVEGNSMKVCQTMAGITAEYYLKKV